MNAKGEIICPATNKPCPSQELGKLTLNQSCEGSGKIGDIEYCRRKKVEIAPGRTTQSIIEHALRQALKLEE